MPIRPGRVGRVGVVGHRSPNGRRRQASPRPDPRPLPRQRWWPPPSHQAGVVGGGFDVDRRVDEIAACFTPKVTRSVTPDYSAHTSRFTGKIPWVQLDVGIDDHDHYIDPEERFRIAMARQ